LSKARRMQLLVGAVLLALSMSLTGACSSAQKEEQKKEAEQKEQESKEKKMEETK
jgi:uncharacterized lipoprotein